MQFLLNWLAEQIICNNIYHQVLSSRVLLGSDLLNENRTNSSKIAGEALNLIECKAQEWIHVVGNRLFWASIGKYWPVLEKVSAFQRVKQMTVPGRYQSKVLLRLYMGRLLTLVLLTAVLHHYLWYTNPQADPCNLHKACSPRKPWLSSSQAQEQGTWPRMFHHHGL